MKKFALFLVVGCCTLSLSCLNPVTKGYSGRKRPLSEVALLSLDHGLVVTSVDGKRRSCAYYLELLPGRHTLTFAYITTTSRSMCDLTVHFEVEAERRYEATVMRSGLSWDVQITPAGDYTYRPSTNWF